MAAQPYRIGQPLLVDLSNADAVLQVLASNKCVAMGFAEYPSFSATGADGIVKPVQPSEQLCGGHAVLICGATKIGDGLHFIIRNSWGTGWADKGFCYAPAGYVADHELEGWTA